MLAAQTILSRIANRGKTTIQDQRIIVEPSFVVAESCGFTVEDEGTGMTQETLRHACEPFWKADKARTRRHGGAGLGLSLCQRIAELHRGRLFFDSAPGKGTRVTFTTSLQLPDDSLTSSMA